MFPGNWWSRALCVVALASFGAGAQAQAAAASAADPVVVSGLGRGTVALDGPWQFRVGDDAAWAAAGLDDAGWERVDVSKFWGDQGNWAYTGYAWYRRHV